MFLKYAKAKFCDVEKIEKKLVTLKLHLEFNEIYIYIYYIISDLLRPNKFAWDVYRT